MLKWDEPGNGGRGLIYVKLGAQGLNGGMKGDEFEAEEVVAVLNALGDGDCLDAFVLDLERSQEILHVTSGACSGHTNLSTPHTSDNGQGIVSKGLMSD